MEKYGILYNVYIFIYLLTATINDFGKGGSLSAHMRKDRRQAALNRVATKQDLVMSTIIGFAFVLIFGVCSLVLFLYLKQPLWYPIALTALVCVVYAIGLGIWSYTRARKDRAVLDYSITTLLDSPVGRVIQKMTVPVIACDNKWVLFWYNDAVESIFQSMEQQDGEKRGQGASFPVINAGDEYLQLADRKYRYQQIDVASENKKYRFFVLEDCTELLAVSEAYHNDYTAVAYIAIDSVEEMTQYANESVRDALGKVDDIIKRWIDEMDAVIKSYDNDKYIVLMDTRHLEQAVRDKFEILDEIRSIRVGDGISITISMGVSNITGSLEEREKNAQGALDLALQRGGDQVVYKRDDGISFFGGRTKAIYKRSNVKARVISGQIVSMICRASNVLIMGHRTGDFDSFASCVGIAKLASVNQTPFHIVVDKTDKNLIPCFANAAKISALKDRFVSAKEALGKIKDDTLLIVCDVNNLSFTESPEVAKKVRTIVVVDHHIKKEELPDSVKVSYIEPTASSASELVTELLQYGTAMIQLQPEEASLLLSGILLDTKQFTKNTGTRTFSVAQFLRGQGANTQDANEMFRSEVDEMAKESKLLSGVQIYDGDIAIASCDGENDVGYRVLASKVADKMLTIKGVEASFALVKIKNSVFISGRSNGHINVQLILEELKGGGHFDAAGAQVEGKTIEEVQRMLLASVERFKQNNE